MNEMLRVLFAVGCVSTLCIPLADDRPLWGCWSLLICLLNAVETKSSIHRTFKVVVCKLQISVQGLLDLIYGLQM